MVPVESYLTFYLFFTSFIFILLNDKYSSIYLNTLNKSRQSSNPHHHHNQHLGTSSSCHQWCELGEHDHTVGTFYANFLTLVVMVIVMEALKMSKEKALHIFSEEFLRFAHTEACIYYFTGATKIKNIISLKWVLYYAIAVK